MQLEDEADEGPSNATTVLDLQNAHLQDLASMQIAPELTHVDVTCNRFTCIDPRILALTGLVSLCMRQNLLGNASVAAWSGAACAATLQDLEFRDNQLTEIPDLAPFSRLTRLEFSYNEVRSMQPVSSLPAGTPLQELYLAQNKISAIQGLSELTQLTCLELGSNRIRTIEGLEGLTGLQELWLGRNRISSIQNLVPLTRLRRISIQSNRLESCEGLAGCSALEELYLSHNGIRQLQGLDTLTQLRLLDVSSNLITTVQGLGGLSQLEDLWLNDNKIPDLGQALAEGLAPVAHCLTVIYMEGNPAAKLPGYKARMQELLPHLKQLDADQV